jgi:hypothetical protein
MPLETIAIIVSTVSAIISSVVALIAIWLSLTSSRHEQKVAIKESTAHVFEEWWSEDMRELRRYFFLEFIPIHRNKLIGKSLKETIDVVPEDKGRIIRLCYFFDRIGWLGAAGLIDMDYILGPMQHTMRRTWIVVEPLIIKARELKTDKGFDPVYHYGFEWLFKRSGLPNKHQANLLRWWFVQPSIFTRKEISFIKSAIEVEESEFRRTLENILNQKQTKVTRKSKAK